MSDQDTIAAPDVRGTTPEPQLYSEAWWHERNAEELRLIMSRGPSIGATFDGATAEVERRARERLREQEATEVAKGTRNRRMRRIVLEGLLLACLLILLAIGLAR